MSRHASSRTGLLQSSKRPSRPSCSASCSTPRRTNGSRPRRPASGDRDLVYKALLAHPLIGQLPQVEELTERLLKEGRAHLPQFEQPGWGHMKQPLVLAIDGGNWKTDLALVLSDGEVLALVLGP